MGNDVDLRPGAVALRIDDDVQRGDDGQPPVREKSGHGRYFGGQTDSQMRLLARVNQVHAFHVEGLERLGRQGDQQQQQQQNGRRVATMVAARSVHRQRRYRNGIRWRFIGSISMAANGVDIACQLHPLMPRGKLRYRSLGEKTLGAKLELEGGAR